jgi:hypothetical protein
MFKSIRLISSVFCLLFSATLFAGDGCYMCGSGSDDNIKQCKYHSSDTQNQRKNCKKAGCKISGTSSCSSAANVKVIDPN